MKKFYDIMRYLVMAFLAGLIIYTAIKTAHADESTVRLFTGTAALNQGDSTKTYSKTYQLEQENMIGSIPVRLGYTNEGSLSCGNFSPTQTCKRDGLYGMAVIKYRLDDKFESSASLGPYAYDETVEYGSQYHISTGVALIGALAITYRISKQWDAQVRFQHIGVSIDGRNVDQILFGIGRVF